MIKYDLIEGDCLEKMQSLWFIDMIVTSPPYFNARDYSQWKTYEDYLEFMRKFTELSFSILPDGGRFALNVPDGYGRGEAYISLYADILQLVRAAGFFIRGSIVWDKSVKAGRTSWGSWRSSSNPTLIDVHEMIIVAHKGSPRIESTPDSIGALEFMRDVGSVWHISPETRRKLGHPAPFPVELPRRLIQLYSAVGMTILDPFSGINSTGIACSRMGRNYIGIEKNHDYFVAGQNRMIMENDQLPLWNTSVAYQEHLIKSDDNG